MGNIFYKDGYKYQLAETYRCRIDICPEQLIVSDYVHLTDSGLLVIFAGYV
jgi:hypothetical protein